MFSEEEIQMLCEKKIIGSFYPYNQENQDAVISYIKLIVSDLNNSDRYKIVADYSMYGSGYASYVDIFCFDKNNISNEELHIQGIQIYICKHTPMAVISGDHRDKSNVNSFKSFITHDTVGNYNKNLHGNLANYIELKLNKYGISILKKKEIEKRVDTNLLIPTFLSNNDFRLYDVIFYWED